MNKLNVAIIEDEVPAARLLLSMIERLRPDWQVTVIPGSVEEAVQWFGEHPHPDIIFLDIQLSDGNSFNFISTARPSSVIIFTTAYDEYAIRAFSVNSIDYFAETDRRGAAAGVDREIRGVDSPVKRNRRKIILV